MHANELTEQNMHAFSPARQKISIMNSQLSMSKQENSIQEFKRLEQIQTNLLLNINLVLKRDIEECLNQQENILDENGNTKEEITKKIIEKFMEFAKDIILHQERAEKAKNGERITAKDIDDQLHQANLFNWWTTKQIDLYHKLKKLYHLQRAKEYED